MVEPACLYGGGAVYDRYAKALKRSKARLVSVGEGERITGFYGTEIIVLNPGFRPAGECPESADPNNESVVIKIACGKASAIFCGDIKESAMARMISAYGSALGAGIMKVPHHGSGLGDMGAFLDFVEHVDPDVSVISSRREDGGAVSYETARRALVSSGSSCYVTGESGLITVKFDGKKYLARCFAGCK